ncbi:hypothetical protein GOV14_00350 [Candidatus Pacearchaeota archaeon]|nr:hypothetical protein [Candidatus Pacearchaeota archaeon]
MLSDIFVVENWFLLALGVVWIIGAVMQDLKRREVDNLWNFSLIAFAIVYRLIVSISIGNYWYFFNGVLGFLLFVVLGNLFYYGRVFAGGDAKLLIALGSILPLSYSWITNFEIFGLFILLFMILGSVYALLWSFVLVFLNFKQFKAGFVKYWKMFKKLIFVAIILAVLWIIFVFSLEKAELSLVGLILVLFPILFVFAKTIENTCMVKLVEPKKVTLGDWLYKDIKIKGKKIKSNWEGVSEEQLKLIKSQKKKILIKYGIPFTPSFLFAFFGLLIVAWRYGWI